MRLREVKPKVTQLISGAAERPSQHPGLLSPLGHSLLPALTRTRTIFSKLAGQGTIFFFFFLRKLQLPQCFLGWSTDTTGALMMRLLCPLCL